MQPIQTALLSFGMSGKLFHAPFIEVHPGFTLYAVWERSRDEARKKYPQVKTYRSLEELLEDQAVELVIVNTPNYTHFEYAKKALLAGKDVIVEKPFTVTVAEGAELMTIAEKGNRKLSVYQNRRYDSDFKTVRDVLKKGWLGNIIEAEFHFDRYREDLSPKKHKETPGPGTGALYDLGAHLIDQALQLFGRPASIFADIQTVRKLSQVDDYFELLLYYPGMRVRLRCSYLVREALPGYILHGSKGSFIKPKTNVQEADLMAGKIPGGSDWGIEPEAEKGLLHTEKEGQIVRAYIPSFQGNYLDYYTGIYEAIRNNKPLPVSAEEGLEVIRVIEKAFASSREKRVLAY
ncbi:MAG: Gfo/Idh/MocA family oxidoreductase [Flavisolibacter sp.]